MGNPHNRPKHKQHRSWFRVEIDGEPRIVRPVNGEDWFNEPSYSIGRVHLIDESSSLVGTYDIGAFDKTAIRVGSDD